MQLLIIVLWTILAGTLSSVSARIHANDGLLAFTTQQDTSLAEYERKSEEKYFAISAILEQGVKPEDLSDSIGPYVKGLSLEFRERIYKERKRVAIDNMNPVATNEAMLAIPVIASIRQGDGIGVAAGLVGITCLGVAALGNSGSSVQTNSEGPALLGVGLLVFTTIRAYTVNGRNINHNKALAEALRLPTDFTFSISPTLRSLPDGTRIPALSLSMQLR